MKEKLQKITAAEGVDYNDVYVYASEMTSRDAVQCCLGTLYEVEDYNDDGTTTYSRYSTADCYVTNTTTENVTIWETKARPDIEIDTYQDGFFQVGKARKLSDKVQKKHPDKRIMCAIIYPKSKSVVVYPLEILRKFPTRMVKAWDPDKGEYVDELNHLVPVSDIDRVHDAGGYVRHWKGCDWDDMYRHNERMGIELSAQGLI